MEKISWMRCDRHLIRDSDRLLKYIIIWLSVTFEPVQTFEKPVILSQIKETPELANIGLLKQPRLSVMPLTKAEFELIIKLAK